MECSPYKFYSIITFVDLFKMEVNMNLQSLILELVTSLGCNHRHRKQQTFYCFIKFQFDEYERLLKKVDKKQFESMLSEAGELMGKSAKLRFLNLMKVIHTKCLEILQLAYKGDVLNASALLEKLLMVKKYTKGYLQDMYVNYLKNEEGQGNCYYRIVDFPKGKMLPNCNHMPYNLRSKASAGRFNLLGIPCLYLASSEKTALLELGDKNENNSRWLGTFKALRNLRFLKFTIPSVRDISAMSDYDKFSFLVTYPLLQLCLVPVADENARFHEEYLFSQLFTHIMYMNKNSNFYSDGISYSSMRDKGGVNYIIPALYKQREPVFDDRISDFVSERVKEIKKEIK